MRISIQLARLTMVLTFFNFAQNAVSAPGTGLVTTGAVVPTPAPPSLVRNAFESNTTIALIQERTNYLLPISVMLDVDGSPGVYDQLIDLTGGELPGGQAVDIHILHFDPILVPFTPVRVSGSVTFSRPIIGMVFQRLTLNATDAYGTPDTLYPTSANPVFREFEFGPIGTGVSDLAAISPDGLTLSLNWGGTEYFDQLRVFTAVPEPRTLGLLSSLALAAIACGVKRPRFR